MLTRGMKENSDLGLESGLFPGFKERNLGRKKKEKCAKRSVGNSC